MEKTFSEADILSELVSPEGGDFEPEGARALLALRFTPKAVTLMNELAEKSRLGTLSSKEEEEMKKFMRVGNFLNLIKAKARLALSKSGSTAQ